MSNDLELQVLWESYVAANMRYSSLEAQKQAKLTAKVRVPDDIMFTYLWYQF